MKSILVNEQTVLLFGKDGSDENESKICAILLSLADGSVTNIVNDLPNEIQDLTVAQKFSYCKGSWGKDNNLCLFTAAQMGEYTFENFQ